MPTKSPRLDWSRPISVPHAIRVVEETLGIEDLHTDSRVDFWAVMRSGDLERPPMDYTDEQWETWEAEQRTAFERFQQEFPEWLASPLPREELVLDWTAYPQHPKTEITDPEAKNKFERAEKARQAARRRPQGADKHEAAGRPTPLSMNEANAFLLECFPVLFDAPLLFAVLECLCKLDLDEAETSRLPGPDCFPGTMVDGVYVPPEDADPDDLGLQECKRRDGLRAQVQQRKKNASARAKKRLVL